VWDAATLRPLVETTGHTAAVRTVDVSPDGRLALTIGADRSARVWNLATGREVRAFPLPPDVRPTLTPDGAAVRIPLPDRVVLRDLVTGLEITSASPGEPPPESFPVATALLRRVGLCVAVSPDGRTAAVGDRTGAVELYELATGQVRRVLVGHRGACLDVAFTPDGSRLLSAGADQVVLVWGVRVRDVPLPDVVKRETSAVKLWDRMTHGGGVEAYQAMARLAADPAAAVKMARLRLKPGTEAAPIGEARVVELLEAVGTVDARALLRDLADDEADGVRFRTARAALARLGEPRYDRNVIRPVGGTMP
jgi:WD40 repeat protein